MYFAAVLLDSLTQHCSRDLWGSIPAEACGTKQVGGGIWEEALVRRHPDGRGTVWGGSSRGRPQGDASAQKHPGTATGKSQLRRGICEQPSGMKHLEEGGSIRIKTSERRHLEDGIWEEAFGRRH